MCVYANVCLLCTIKEKERNRMRNTEEAREGSMRKEQRKGNSEKKERSEERRN